MLPFLLLLTCWSSLIWARPNPNDVCFGACQIIFESVRFNATNSKTGVPWTKKGGVCGNELAIPSLYLCNKLFCSEEERERGLDGLNRICHYLNATLPPFSIIEQYTDDDIERLRQLQPEEVSWPAEAVSNEVVIPSEKLFLIAKDTLDTAYFEAKIHIIYGIAMHFFWVVVITIGLSSHLLRHIVSLRNQEQKWQPLPDSDTDQLENRTPKRKESSFILSTLLKRYITVPATFGYTRSQNIGWCTVPTRIQSVTIGAFVTLNVVLCSISYHVFPYNLYWSDVSTQKWRYVADRTGVISTANLGLIWAFGIRNNTLLWLTGWDFATYNNFHRWVARVATLEAVVHSVAYTVLIFKDGSFSDGWILYVDCYTKWWFVAGVLATIFMCAICGFSVYVLRRNFYETFLLLHIILSVLVIVTMCHVEIFSGLYNWFIWPCIFIWIFDRVARILRILLFNPKFWKTKALTTHDSNSNILRLAVPYSTSFIKPRPGTFYYITSLNDLMIWESHPFTLGYLTGKHDSSSASSSRSPSSGTIPLQQQRSSPNTRDHGLVFSDDSSPESENLLEPSTKAPPFSMVFIIRPYNGFTARLRNSALSAPTNLRVLIDGPYGVTQPFQKYENVLFMVGGAGISVPLSYLNLLLAEDSNTASIRIIWAVPEHKFLTDAIDIDFRGALENEKVSLEAYVTQASEFDKDEMGSLMKEVRVHHGRPDVYKEVEEAARDSGNGVLAVVACGPGMMADDARKAVVGMLGRGFRRIEYFEESFNW